MWSAIFFPHILSSWLVYDLCFSWNSVYQCSMFKFWLKFKMEKCRCIVTRYSHLSIEIIFSIFGGYNSQLTLLVITYGFCVVEAGCNRGDKQHQWEQEANSRERGRGASSQGSPWCQAWYHWQPHPWLSANQQRRGFFFNNSKSKIRYAQI